MTTKITGHRELTEEEIAIMNEGKELELEIGKFLKKINALPNSRKRDLHVARTHIQTGIMFSLRAVARPGGIDDCLEEGKAKLAMIADDEWDEACAALSNHRIAIGKLDKAQTLERENVKNLEEASSTRLGNLDERVAKLEGKAK